MARLVASGLVGGEIATPVCHDGSSLLPGPFASVAGRVRARALSDALVIDTGGLLARHGVARFIARSEPDALAQMVDSLGYRALALGEADLADPRRVLLARARALRERGVPMLASNIRCTEAAAELCDVMVTSTDGVPTHEVGTERIAIFSFLDPKAEERIAPDRMEGLTIAPLAPALGVSVSTARERGATMVIAIIDSGEGAEAAGRVLGFVSNLEEQQKPDLILVANAGSELLFARPSGFRPAIVAAPPHGAADIDIRRRENGFSFFAEPIARSERPAAPIVELTERIGGRYCEELGERLPGSHLDPERELDVRGFAELTAGAMRDAVGADVTLLNLDGIDSRWHQVRPGGLTEADIEIALQYDEPLVVGTVSAFWLRQLARSAPEDRGLLSLGLTITNPYAALERVKVNTRTLDDNTTYEVVTLRFLAEGGDGGTVPEGVEWRTTEHTIRSVMRSFLAEEREGDPRDHLVDPWDRLEWTLGVNTDFTFAGTAVRDSGNYEEGPLTNARQMQFGLKANVSLNAVSRTAAWENLFDMNYTLAATEETDGFDEGADTLTYRTTGLYRGFRALRDEIYVPDLLIEGLLRTELTPVDDAAHFMNVRFVGGIQWRFNFYVNIKLVGGVEILQALDSDARNVQPGLGVQLNMSPWIIMKEGLRKLTLATTLDYFVSGPGDLNRQLLQGLFDLQLNLNRFFALSLNVTLYGLKQRADPFSIAFQTLGGLRVSWVGRRVQRSTVSWLD